MSRRDDIIWNLVTTVESSVSHMTRWQRHAVTCGALEAAGHLMDPGINTLATAHRQGINFFLMQLDRALGRRLAPHFDAGFLGLLVAADVSLDQLRTMPEGRR